MKRLFRNIFILFSLVVIINIVFNNGISQFWGHKNAKLKSELFVEYKNEVNTVFIGSSRIYRQVIPNYFDSLSQNEGLSIYSWNLGVNSFPAPQSFKMLDYILRVAPSVKYVILELTPIYDQINTKILNTPEYNYWYNLNDFYLLSNHILKDKKKRGVKKVKMIREHFQSYLGNFFHIGAGQYYLQSSLENKEWLSHEIVKNKGFVSFQSSIKSKVEFDEKLLDRNRHFLKDTSKLQKRIKIANDFNSSLNKFKMHSSIYESYLKELILKVEGYGAKLIFIIPPRLENYSGYDRLLDILKEGNLVNLSNPIEFPQFYRVENSFDLGHMNEKGARLLTRELFIKFKEYYEHFK